MGKVLKHSQKFSNLEGIIRAYRLAFWKDDEKIEKILIDRSLKKLNLVRNVLIHKAGVIDSEFTEKAKKIPEFQEYKKDDVFPMDGLTVQGLVDPVIQRSMDLIRAVDHWIGSHP